MITIRHERIADIAAREALLDEAFGIGREAKTAERLREDRLPADGLSFIATDRGRVVGTDPVGTGRTLVRATVPEAEVIRYAIDLRSMTRGKGSFARRFSHYEELPSNLVGKVIEEAKAESK